MGHAPLEEVPPSPRGPAGRPVPPSQPLLRVTALQPYLKAPFPPTLADALERLLEQTAQRVRQGARSEWTLRMQQSHERWLCEQLGAGLPLEAITYRLVLELGEKSAATGRLAAGTISKRLSTLRRALRLAVACGDLAAMPMFPEVANPPYQPRVRILNTYGEYQRLVAALRIERAEWAAVALWTCQRPGDVARMRWSDVGLDADPPWVNLRSTKTRKPTPFRAKVPRPLLHVLRTRRARLTAAGTPPLPTDLLVKPWPGASQSLPVIAARIGLPPLTPMSLRHTGISWLVRRKGLTVAAQRWGGWSSFTMMQKYYAHALPADLLDASDELASIADEPGNDNGGEPPSK